MDRKERDQKQRRAILRDVLHDLSESVAQQYQLIDSAVKDVGEKIDPGTAAMIREANNEIIRVIEMTRETEDPYVVYSRTFVFSRIWYTYPVIQP